MLFSAWGKNFSRHRSETNHHCRSRQGRQPLIQSEKLTSSWLWMKSAGCCELNVMPALRLLDEGETEGHESCSLRHNQSFRHPRLLLTDAKRRISAADGQNTGHRLTTQRCVCVWTSTFRPVIVERTGCTRAKVLLGGRMSVHSLHDWSYFYCDVKAKVVIFLFLIFFYLLANYTDISPQTLKACSTTHPTVDFTVFIGTSVSEL